MSELLEIIAYDQAKSEYYPTIVARRIILDSTDFDPYASDEFRIWRKCAALGEEGGIVGERSARSFIESEGADAASRRCEPSEPVLDE